MNIKKQDFKKELCSHIIPYWLGLRDELGFIGRVDASLHRIPEADKGVILNSRILWFFSSCYLALKEEELLSAAGHAYRFLRGYCLDREYGGVYWMMHADGSVADDQKHCYCQAFAVYALSVYSEASGDKEALSLAMDIARRIEACRDEYGYRESFTRDWQPRENEELSENGIKAEKTMNTTLHVLEAYTALYRAGADPQAAAWLKAALALFQKHIYNPEQKRLEVFFDAQMHSLADLHSYGHDIEASWLLDEACRALGEEEMSNAFAPIIEGIARHVGEVALEQGHLNNERIGELTDRTRVWWVQAEGIVGFANLYRRTGEERYQQAAEELWAYTKEHLIDTREGGEWLYELDERDVPLAGRDITGPWKCPYHNGRMCLEMMKRLEASV